MKLVFKSCLFVILASCAKEKVSITGAEANGVILAGKKGASKSWRLTKFNVSANGAAPQPITIYACNGDDVFKFSNNDNQDFEHNDGSLKCNSTDPSIIENGSWALTLNGTRLDLGLTVYTNSYLLGDLGPGSVTSLTEESMDLTFNQTASTNKYILYLHFEKV